MTRQCEDTGSSPLTRGKRLCRASPTLPGRLIPAHAGKTGATTSCPGAPPAHPRSRGENAVPRTDRRRQRGSSPLTRGKPVGARTRSVSDRLIPAHAGKTSCETATTAGTAAHPRSRGENHLLLDECEERFGSSPLTRGKHRAHGLPARGIRLIPAHAGKTSSR